MRLAQSVIIVVLAATLAMTAGVSQAATVGTNTIGGDADCDIGNDLRDAWVSAQGWAGSRTESPDCTTTTATSYALEGCDVDDNGTCDELDVRAMLGCQIDLALSECAISVLGPCPGTAAEVRFGDEFVLPQVTYTDEHPGSTGSEAWARLFPDLEEITLAIAADVAAALYLDSSDVPQFDTIALVIVNDPNAVASNQPQRPLMTIRVGSDYIASVAAQGDAAARYELEGMLAHEIVHGYQGSPLPLNLTGINEYLGAIEGVADAVRISLGRHQFQQPVATNSDRWRAGYTTTGFFLQYLGERYDHQIVPKFNAAITDLGGAWNFDAAFNSILGRGIEDLWSEYETYLNSGGTLDYDGDYLANRTCQP